MEDDYSRSPQPSPHNSNQSDSDDDDRQRQLSGDEGIETRQDSEDEEKKKKKEKKKSDKPKGPVRRMLISEDMLGSRNGVTKLGEIFKDFEFRGKGKEKEDLSRMLNKYEQWIHMLHPKYPFDQCLERIEFLGTKKKSVKTLIKKIRMGMLPLDHEPNDIIEDDVDEGNIFPDEGGNMFPNEGNTNDNNSAMDFGSDDELDIRKLDEIENGAINGFTQDRVMTMTNNDNDDVPSLDEQLELERELENAM